MLSRPSHAPNPPGMALRAALVLAAAAAAAAAASSAPPSPPAIVIDAGNVTNAAINRRVLGMHCDPGYNQQASAFRASMLYSAGFVSAGVLAPVTAFPDPFTAAGPAARSPAYFSTYNFMDYSRASAFTVGTNAPFNNAPTAQLAVAGPAGQPGDALGAAVTERGMGNEGLYFEAGKPYEGRVILRALTTTTVLIGLRDYVSGVMLANVTAKVVFGGSGPPPYDSIPNRTFTTLAFNLTPAVGTACDIIPPGSDPAIDCTNRGGKQAPSDAHVCVRCGGEFVIGILGGGSVYLAYAELMPGPWGRAAGPNGPLPALKSGADLLTRMGTTMVRQGGA